LNRTLEKDRCTFGALLRRRIQKKKNKIHTFTGEERRVAHTLGEGKIGKGRKKWDIDRNHRCGRKIKGVWETPNVT